ncbi:sphingosine kinase 1-like [Phalaenopsis equestris]|uniref:sphingosine kinase 1-like n=1 Tax=Phalaenopsis equestris TaxID=78828 RepID=UPI0009E1C7CA|nr:sphingosine kinase 1-like [Phalaenopsis equestris]
MKLRKYHGNIEFVPAHEFEFHGEPKNGREIIASNVAISQQGRDGDAEVLHGYQGPNFCFEDSDWRIMEGPFITIMLANLPWVVEDAMAAPEAKFSDGFLDLVLIKDCPKSALACILLKTADGSHVKSPYVMYLKVKAFKLVPGNRVGDSAKGGIIDVDGEVIARGEGVYMCGLERDPMTYGPPILLTVDKGLASIFSSR